MGQPSYEGAIDGYLFKCPITGETHHKLYASHEQFAAAVFQFLTHVEGEGQVIAVMSYMLILLQSTYRQKWRK